MWRLCSIVSSNAIVDPNHIHHFTSDHSSESYHTLVHEFHLLSPELLSEPVIPPSCSSNCYIIPHPANVENKEASRKEHKQ